MPFFYNLFDRLGRAFSAGIREFQKEESEIDRCPDVRSFKNWDLTSAIRGLDVKRDRSIPLEGIEGRDKWLKENFQINIAERVIAALNSVDDGCFNSLDAMLTLNKPVPPESMDTCRGRTATELEGGCTTEMEKKLVERIGKKDGPNLVRKLLRACGEQRWTLYARAQGYYCTFKYEEWLNHEIIVPEEWHCCEKGPPAKWELTWMKEQVEIEREYREKERVRELEFRERLERCKAF